MSELQHGTNNAYVNGRCRCDPCRAAARAYRIAYRERTKDTREAARHAGFEARHAAIGQRVATWKAVYEAGHASRVCDSIVRNRPVPVELLLALFGEEVEGRAAA